jgi:hypothetical protein
MMDRSGSAGRAVGALILIGLGVLFLLGQFFSFSWLWEMWPLFIIAPGAVFLYFAYTGSRDAAGLAIPGAIVTGTGLLLLVQSITNQWQSWAYVWTLYPAFLGLGLMFMGRRTDSEGTYRTGRSFVQWSLIAFLVFGSFFEIFIFGGFGVGKYILPLALIGAGAWLLLRPRGTARFSGNGHKPKREEDPFFMGAPSPRPRGGHAPSASDSLRKRIDEALSEDGEPVPTEPMDEEK